MLKTVFQSEGGPEFTRQMQVLFAYLFDKIGKYEYRKQIGDKVLAKQIWSAAKDSGYVLKNCKLYIWAFNHAKRSGLAVSPAKFGIYSEDAALLRKIELPKISSKFKPYSLFDYDNMEAAILTSPEISNYIGKFVNKKLKFLQSYGQTKTGMGSTLLCQALYALRKQYPFYQSELHAVNICKTAIHNEGIGLIEYWTRGKRNALIKENGTFQAVHVQYEVLSDVGVEPEHQNELRLNLSSLVAISGTLPALQQRFLSAAAGLYDPGVSLFIGTDNTNAVDKWKYPRYLNQVRTYFGFSEQEQVELLSSLRKKLL